MGVTKTERNNKIGEIERGAERNNKIKERERGVERLR